MSQLQESRGNSRVNDRQKAMPQKSSTNSPAEKSDDSFTIVQNSLVGSSKRSEGLSQFEEIGAVLDEDSVEGADCPRG